MWSEIERAELLRPAIRRAREEGWAVIDFPSWELEIMAGMFDAMVQTEDRGYLKQWEFYVPRRFDPKDKPDDGVVVRDPGNWTPEQGKQAPDDKIFFHEKRGLLERLEERGVDLTRHRELLLRARRFNEFCSSFVLPALARAFDREYPWREWKLYDLVREQAALEKHCLRMVWYRNAGKTHEEEIASPHTDRDFLTIHPWMKYGGLRLGESGQEVPCMMPSGSALIFFGDKAELLTNGFVRALRHRVVHEDGHEGNRTACIFFGHTDTPHER